MKEETKLNFNSNGIKVIITKDKDYTLEDLRQKLINDLCEKPLYSYESKDVEILKILFEIKEKEATTSSLGQYHSSLKASGGKPLGA